jgi:hypothetical protein
VHGNAFEALAQYFVVKKGSVARKRGLQKHGRLDVAHEGAAQSVGEAGGDARPTKRQLGRVRGFKAVHLHYIFF